MQVHCRCGQEFTVGAGSFPRKVACHVCGHGFTVLDDGEVIDTDAERGRREAGSTAITSNANIEQPRNAPYDAFCADEHIDLLSLPASITEELVAFERQFQSTIQRFMLLDLIPTRRKGLVIGVGIGGTFLAMMVIELIWFYAGINWVLVIGAGLGATVGGWLYRRGERYERAKYEWSVRRAELHSRCRLTPDAIENLVPFRRVLLTSVPAILLFLGLICGVAFLLMLHGMFWVGARDMEVTFVVTDADTGEPIPNAQIEVVRANDGFCQKCGIPFRLQADEQGTAKRRCEQCMCFGFSGCRPFFRWVETFGSHTPSWTFEVSAPGFDKTDPLAVGNVAFRKTIERGDEFATMKVAVQLHRKPAKK